MRVLKKIFFPFCSVILAVFTVLPLFHQGFFTIHDDEQIARLYDLNQALLAGHIPPRIAPNLGFGFGYPFFNFYPSFAYYVAEFFHLFGFGYIVSTKLMIAAGFFLAAFFMYLLAKEIFGKWEAVLSSVAYTFISYHAIDVYVRGALAEFFAFVFLPLIFWSLIKLQKELKSRYIIVGSISVASLVLSHNLVAFMSTPFIAVFILYLFFASKFNRMFILYIFTLFLLGFGLSAYFSLPSYFERGYTLINILTSELANYNLHFVCLHQLWDSPWGYGGSIPGCYDGISFEIGKIQLVLSVIAIILAFLFLRDKKQSKNFKFIALFFALLIFSAFFMTKYSKPIWDTLPPLWYIQFPWRFLIFSSFFSSLLCAGAVSFLHSEKIRGITVTILVVALISTNLNKFTPQRFFNTTDSKYTSLEKIRWETSSLAYEYVPKGISTKKSKENTTQVNITENEIKKSDFAVVSGEMSVTELSEKPQEKKFNVDVKKNGIFRINTFSFPGWVLYVNREKRGLTDKNKLKLIDVSLSQGSYVIEAKFTDTPVRTAGNTISILSIILTAGLCVFSAKRRIL